MTIKPIINKLVSTVSREYQIDGLNEVIVEVGESYTNMQSPFKINLPYIPH